MRINDATAGAIAQTYTRQTVTKAGAAAASVVRQAAGRPRTDSISFSATTRDLLRLREVAAAQTDVRPDRVAALKAAITSGKYQVDTGVLAAKLLG